MSKREINLLSKSELSDIYDVPDFDDHERELYFAIDDNEAEILFNIIEKLKQLKYLRDQFEIKHKTNIREVLSRNNAIIFEPKPSYKLKLSIDNLGKDENRQLIIKVRNRYKSAINPTKQLAANLTSKDLELETEKEIYIDLHRVRNDFKQSGSDLFGFLMNYQFVRELSFEERVTVFCQIISMFENELELSDNYLKQNNIEYAVVYPK